MNHLPDGAPTTATAQSLSILIVDSAEADRATCIRSLQRYREDTYCFWEATTLAEGWHQWRSHSPDVILLASHLPDGDGLTLVAALQTASPPDRTPVILLADQEEAHVALQALQLGVLDYRVKGELTALGLYLLVVKAQEQSRWQQAWQRSRQQAAILEKIAQNLQQSLPLDTILATTVQAMRAALAADRVVVCQVPPDTDGNFLAEAVSAPWPSLESAFILAMDSHWQAASPSGSATPSAEQPWVITDVQTAHLSDRQRQALASWQVQASLVVPIRVLSRDRQPWGLMMVHQCSAPRQWTTDEVHWVEQVATQLAIAVQHMNLASQLSTSQSALTTPVTTPTAMLSPPQVPFQRVLESASRTSIFSMRIHADQTWKYLYQSQGCAHIFGYTADELMADNALWWSHVHPADRHTILMPLFAQFFNETSTSAEFRFRHRDGHWRWIDATYTSQAEPSGNTWIVTGVCRDITAQKRAQAQLAATESIQRALIEALPDLLVHMRGDGHYLAVKANPNFPLIRPLSELEGHNVREILPPAEAEQRLQMTGIALQTGTVQEYEFLLCVNGHDRWQEVRIAPVRGDEVLVVVRDITDRKKAELELKHLNEGLEQTVAQRTATLRAREAQLNAIVEAIPDLLLRVDVNGYCLDSFKSDQLESSSLALAGIFLPIQHHLSEVLPPPQLAHQLQIIRQAIATGELQVYEQQLQKAGKTFHEEIRIVGLNQQEALIIVRDITQRKQTEQENQFLKERLEFLLAASPAVIYSCRAEAPYRANFISANVTKLLGFPAEQFLTTPGFWRSRLHPEDADQVIHRIAIALEQGHRQFEYRLRHADGHYIWVWDELRLISDAEGMPLEVVGYMADISDRKEAELALYKTEERYSRATRAAKVGVWEWHLGTNAFYLDPNIKALLGYADEEIPNELEAWITYIHPSDREAVMAAAQTYLAGETAEYTLEHRMLHRDGSIVWILVRGQLPYDAEGEPERLVGTDTDITQLKQAETQLRKNDAHLRTAQRIGKLGSWEFDVVTETIWWSEEVFRIFGRDPQLGPPNFADLQACLHPDDRELHVATLQDAIANLSSYEIELRAYRPDGDLVYLQSRGEPVINGGDQQVQFLGTVLDITDRKVAEAELKNTNAALARATRLKDEFLANMSHELRTPLNAILGMSEGLQEHAFGTVNGLQRKALQTIQQSGTHLLELINDILDLSKIEAGHMTIHPEPTAVVPLCEASLAFVRQQALKKRIQLTMQITPNLPPLHVEERRIRQVLINLLSNAVKFTPIEGKISLKAIPLPPSSPGDSALVRLMVEDSGIGISPDDLKQLFQPFVQIDSALNRKYEGTGLGLALVKRIVELHGGQVSVTSTLQTGSCFMVDLPCIQNAVLPALSPPSSSISPKADPKTTIASPLILLAEANEASLLTIANYLQAKGHQLLLARTGPEAIAQVQTQQPALILLADNLAEARGDEEPTLLEYLRQDTSLAAIPLIGLIGAEPAIVPDWVTRNAQHYLRKPIKLKELNTQIQERLSRYP